MNKKVTVIGTGVIGNGWIARFLANGFTVTALDPAPGAEDKTRDFIQRIWPTLESKQISSDAAGDHLTFETDIVKAVEGAILIQENAPERKEVKQQLLSDIDRHAAPDTLIASSTSGYKPSVLQEQCQIHPGRVIVAHPFHPVYLLPLVEISGGRHTDQTILQKAEAFYLSVQMKPLVMSGEIDGHIADRLMEALWREALHLVNDGTATTEEVDTAIVYGAGLRWALMGPFLTFHLAGGDKGMAHMLEQFGPTLKLPWTKLQAPELTSELREKIISGTADQAGDQTMSELEQRRDQFLLKLMKLLQEEKYWPAEKVISQT